MTRSQIPGDLSGFGSGRRSQRVRTGDAIIPSPCDGLLGLIAASLV